MTSESYARDEEWAPLPTAARQWETPASSPPSPLPATHARSLSNPAPNPSDGDFAEEASLHAAHDHFPDRPPAPRLSADHVWGVREDWGERARGWGRGAAAYDRDDATASRAPRDVHPGRTRADAGSYDGY